MSSSLIIDSSRFLIDSCYSSTQFHELYKHRLSQLTPQVLLSLPSDPPVCSRINQMLVETPCSIIGVIFKNLTSRPDVVKQYREIGFDSQPIDLTTSDTDTVFIEDITGRIQLSGVSADRFPTGVVLGVVGKLESSKSKFQVLEVHGPAVPFIPRVPSPGWRIGFVSALEINSSVFDRRAAKGLAAAMSQCSLCVVLGNSFEEKPTDGSETLSFQVRMKENKWPITLLESFLGMIKAPLMLMPGRNDPCAIRLPQRPFHRCLFPGKDKWNLVTNPVKFKVEEITFLCASGEAPRDVAKTTELGFHEAQRSLIGWRHLAPTAPDDLPAIASNDKDYLVIEDEDLPEFFVCGLADTFEESNVEGVRVISVPEFASTKSAVFLDLATGDAVQRNFADFQ
jgi:DNA polymerase delta subunit 2